MRCLVYLSTVVVSSCTGDEWALSAGGVSKARGAEEPLGSGTTVHGTVGPSQVFELLWVSVPTDVKQYAWG